jgi:two-component system sensor histidine kinase PilS (NtrC family)
LNNGAVIDYEYRAEISGQRYGEASGRFVITFAASDEAAAAQAESGLNTTRT